MSPEQDERIVALTGEVAMLRELVRVLLAQFPDTDERGEQLHMAHQRLHKRFAPMTPEQIACEAAWKQMVPHAFGPRLPVEA